MRCLIAAAAMLAGLGAAAGQGLQSQYSNLQACPETQSISVPGQTYVDDEYTSITLCAGPAGWSLYVVDQDPRSFIVVDDGQRAYSLEGDMLQVGVFPNVIGTKKAEWMLDGNGRPAALIVRVSFMVGNAAKTQLLVFDLRLYPPALIGTTTSNQKARDLANG